MLKWSKYDQKTILIIKLFQSFTGMVEGKENDIDLPTVFQNLLEEDIPNIPPGGGLYSK